MKNNKAMKAVADMGKRSAIKSAGVFCHYFWHQPKTPAKLLEMKKSK